MADFFGMNKSAVEDLVSQQELYELYAKVAKEIEDGLLDKGVWTKSFADAAGNEAKAKAVYIELMVERLILAKKAQSELEIATSQIKAQNEVDRVRSEKKVVRKKQQSNFIRDVTRPMSKKWWILYYVAVVPLMIPSATLVALIWPDLFSPFNGVSFAICLISGAVSSGILANIVSAILGWDEF